MLILNSTTFLNLVLLAVFVVVFESLGLLFFVLVGLGFELIGLALAKQALYCLSHASSPPLLWLFWRWVL
jgi:Na+/phosphate symporter